MADSKAGRPRLDAIDLVRGIVMILMLLDHTRDFTHRGALVTDPLDPDTTTSIVYLTRWITHLCAPAFVLLAGLGAGLKRLRGTAEAELSHFLWTRGLWLVAIEVVVLRGLIWFNLDLSFLAFLQVIWAIGVSMIVLAALVRLPIGVIAAIGVLIIVGHNALDALRVAPWAGPGSPAPSVGHKLWFVLHQGGLFPIGGSDTPVVLAQYPVLPWIGVMLVGYALSALYAWPASDRRRALVVGSVVMVALFVALRAFNIYGDPRPWTPREDVTRSAMSFFNVNKYPPSLLFTLVTLAPTLFTLAALDGRAFREGPLAPVVTFGRVPLFFYLLQWPTAHLAGILVTAVQGKDLEPYFWHLLQIAQIKGVPDIGGPLWSTYLCWVAGVLLLYWPCRWFAAVKARRSAWWLSYL